MPGEIVRLYLAVGKIEENKINGDGGKQWQLTEKTKPGTRPWRSELWQREKVLERETEKKMSVIEKEDWKNVIGLVTNAKQVVSSVQDVARKLADYTKFRNNDTSSESSFAKESTTATVLPITSNTAKENAVVIEKEGAVSAVPQELFVPGTLFYLKRNTDTEAGRGGEYFTLLKRHPGEHFQRIVLSNNLISNHKCDSHLYALRDVIKGFPGPEDEAIFR